MKIRLSPRYRFAESFVRSLARPGFFDRGGEVLHDGRNQIKLFRQDGQTYVVKRYGHLTLFNRFAYGFLRRSKAERAYTHAIRLRGLGVDTPEEIAFLELRHCGMLRESYFVAAYSDFRPLGPLTACDPRQSDVAPVLDALTAFLFRMHNAGVLHKDLNIGNILYRENPRGGYSFQVIDTNRMHFYNGLSLRRRLDNLRRLSCPTPSYLYVLDRYAALSRADRDSVQLEGVAMRLFFELRQRTKRGLKELLRACGAFVRRRRPVL